MTKRKHELKYKINSDKQKLNNTNDFKHSLKTRQQL